MFLVKLYYLGNKIQLGTLGKKRLHQCSRCSLNTVVLYRDLDLGKQSLQSMRYNLLTQEATRNQVCKELAMLTPKDTENHWDMLYRLYYSPEYYSCQRNME